MKLPRRQFSSRTARGHMRTLLLAMASAVTAFAVSTSGSAAAPAGADFKGATISINIGFASGGSHDTYGRIFARHYGRFIPGHPAVIAKNMQGAGTLRAANYTYNIAPKDGTELAMFSAAAAMEPLIGNEHAKFDAARFGWIGSMYRENSFCGIWQQPGAVTSFQDMLTKETIFGAGGPASVSHQHLLLLMNVLGAKVRLATGYRDGPDVYLAMQRGEVNGICALAV